MKQISAVAILTLTLWLVACTNLEETPISSKWNSGSDSDSTEEIFGFDKINEFSLSFYDSNWRDSLKEHYGEEETFYMPAKFEGKGITLDSVGVRYKGNSSYVASQNTDKKPLKIKFSAFKPQTFFGVSQLNFGNSVKDPSYLREVISYRALSHYTATPRTAYANITADGSLLGLYVQVEQVNSDYLQRHFNTAEGNLYKVGDHGAGLQWHGDDQASYEEEYALKNNEINNDWSRFIALIDTLNNAESDNVYASLNAILDLDKAITLLAFNMVASNFDSYSGSGRNYYLYDNPVSEKFMILPWDQNEAFGSYSNGWDVINISISNPSNLDKRPLNKCILENDQLRKRYFDKIEEMIEGYFHPDTVSNWAEQLKPVIESSVEVDQNKLYSLQNFYTNIDSDISLGLSGSIPGVKSFSHTRTEEIQRQLNTLKE